MTCAPRRSNGNYQILSRLDFAATELVSEAGYKHASPCGRAVKSEAAKRPLFFLAAPKLCKMHPVLQEVDEWEPWDDVVDIFGHTHASLVSLL